MRRAIEAKATPSALCLDSHGALKVSEACGVTGNLHGQALELWGGSSSSGSTVNRGLQDYNGAAEHNITKQSGRRR